MAGSENQAQAPKGRYSEKTRRRRFTTSRRGGSSDGSA
jgi:hypothetical protein